MMISDNNGETLYYGYTDNQGSLVALTDQNGNVVEKYAYDPWGARRNPTDWRYKDTRSGFITNRGYTGHEHLEMFNIINMNGRVYDPLTAMFFSPDPFIQAPDNWLNYNRYGYCMNNLTRYTDPSGYQWDFMDDPKGAMWENHAVGASGISSCLYGVYGSFGAFSVGSGGYSGGFTMDQLNKIGNELYNSPNGGISFGSGQNYYFKSQEEALSFGIIYNNYFDSWANTYAGSASLAYAYLQKSKTGTTLVYNANNLELNGLLAYNPNIKNPYNLEKTYNDVNTANDVYITFQNKDAWDGFKVILDLIKGVGVKWAGPVGDYMTFIETYMDYVMPWANKSLMNEGPGGFRSVKLNSGPTFNYYVPRTPQDPNSDSFH